MTSGKQRHKRARAAAAFFDPPANTAVTNQLAELAEDAKDYARKSLAKNTRRSYESDFRDFEAFCARHNLPALPSAPQTVARYMTTIANIVKPATIERRLAAIRHRHREALLPDPTKHGALKSIMRGIARDHCTPASSKQPITDEYLYAVLRALERRPQLTGDNICDEQARRRTRLATLRDQALLLLGFAGAFRRSELVALDVADLHWHACGLRVYVRSSKTDQSHHGRFKPIPHAPISELDPIHAVECYRQAWNIVNGALFRSLDIDGNPTERRLGSGEVARIVKRAAKLAGLDPDLFAGHSLRSGFVTAAANKGASIPDIAEVSHQSKTTVLRYWTAAKEFVNPPLLAIFGVDTPRSETLPANE